MKNLPVIAWLCSRVEREAGCWFIIFRSAASLFFFAVAFFLPASAQAQCPVNLGFESGTFDNWQCVAGTIDLNGVSAIFPTAPLSKRHKIFSKSSKELDPYGKFPVVCPNGSNYSIRLGNDSTGAQADGVSYTFTVPAGQDDYSIVYNYAVVFQNPEHQDYQQPRFTAKIFDVSANAYITCSSFDFTSSGNLPGFKKADNPDDFSVVYYKPWSSVSLKLLGYAGKTVRLEFTVNDCLLSAHFGYAYFDIAEDCGTHVKGNVICLGPTSTVLTAPYGFQDYHWFNADFSKPLGDRNILRLDPLPSPGTKFAVEIIPYPGSGCRDTLYTIIKTAPIPFAFKVKDTTGTCEPGIIDITLPSITQGSTPDLKFNYYIDSNLIYFATKIDAIDANGKYYIKATNAAGCLDVRQVVVQYDTVPDISIAAPLPASYPQTIDITAPDLITGSTPGMTYSYWKDSAATIRLTNPNALIYGGRFYIMATTKFGCNVIEPIEVLLTIGQPPNVFSPNNDGINDVWDIPSLVPYPQCSVDVYNRSGRLVFHSIGYNKSWDGKLNGKRLPVGTYYYVIRGSTNIAPIGGSITIIY
ncbi:MAG: gliding motility-associated C-terminal domain-containing protein [Bacteroidota bacterium]